MISETVFAVMDDVNISIFKRPSVFTKKIDILDANVDPNEVLKKEAKKAEKKQQFDDNLDGATIVSTSTMESPSLALFSLSSTLPINIVSFNPYKLPTILRIVDIDIVLVGFNDGSIQILSIKQLTDVTYSALTSQVLCEFQAHSVYQDMMQSDLYDGVMSACTASWCRLSGGAAYSLEILSIGSDKKIAHWGLRRINSSQETQQLNKDSQNSLAKAMDPIYSFAVDLLGVLL